MSQENYEFKVFCTNQTDVWGKGSLPLAPRLKCISSYWNSSSTSDLNQEMWVCTNISKEDWAFMSARAHLYMWAFCPFLPFVLWTRSAAWWRLMSVRCWTGATFMHRGGGDERLHPTLTQEELAGDVLDNCLVNRCHLLTFVSLSLRCLNWTLPRLCFDFCAASRPWTCRWDHILPLCATWMD